MGSSDNVIRDIRIRIDLWNGLMTGLMALGEKHSKHWKTLGERNWEKLLKKGAYLLFNLF